MLYFAAFSFDLERIDKDGYASLIEDLHEIGLTGKIKDVSGEMKSLPVNTYIGQYDFENPEELKNTLYFEIKKVFEENNLSGTIFISVSEKAIIGTSVIG